MHYIDDFIDERQKAWCIHRGAWIADVVSDRGHVSTKSLATGALLQRPEHALTIQPDHLMGAIQVTFWLSEHGAAILCPGTLGPAPMGLESTGYAIFNGVLCGTPAFTPPLLESESGMPTGVQLVG